MVFLPIDVSKIIATPLPSVPCDDHMVWIASKDGKFSVRKAYSLCVSMQDSGITPTSNQGSLLQLLKST